MFIIDIYIYIYIYIYMSLIYILIVIYIVANPGVSLFEDVVASCSL